MGCVAGLVENTNGICVTPSAVGCTNNPLNLGTVSFTAGTAITIVGNGVSQIWSRPVTATGCQKETFNSGSIGSANADCRKNEGYAGDFYSGCAAFRYHAQLCPPPWRVPSVFDAANVAIFLGCPVSGNDEVCVKKFVSIWGGEFTGELEYPNEHVWANWTGSLWINDYHYCDETKDDRGGVLRWTNDAGYFGHGQYWWFNWYGWLKLTSGSVLRCVRDN
jgi:hypothetical protein